MRTLHVSLSLFEYRTLQGNVWRKLPAGCDGKPLARVKSLTKRTGLKIMSEWIKWALFLKNSLVKALEKLKPLGVHSLAAIQYRNIQTETWDQLGSWRYLTFEPPLCFEYFAKLKHFNFLFLQGPLTTTEHRLSTIIWKIKCLFRAISNAFYHK